MGKAIIFASDNHVTNNQKNEHMKMKTLLLVTIATLGLAASSMAQNLPNYVPSNGLVGWWPFNGNANNENGNGYNGTVTGASLTNDRFGNLNSAYLFLPDNFIQVAGSNSLNFSDSLSINLWYNNNIVNGGTAYVSKHVSGSFNSSFVIYNEGVNGCGPVNYITDINNQVNSVDYLSFCDTLNWHMLTFVFKKPTLKIFIDGILRDSISSSNSIKSTNNPIIFGGTSILTSPFIGSTSNSSIDDIGIWSRALNQQEVNNLYNGNICYQTITVTDTLLINMGITGFNPVNYNNTIKVFPNPANNHITIDYGNFATLNGYQLKIENSLGQQLFQTNITQQTDYLSLNNWGGNGLYFVHIIDAQGNTIDIRKIVLQ